MTLKQVMAQMNRRYGPTPEPGRRYVTRPGAYAILPRDGALLLTFQARPRAELQLPGGGIDPGESAVRALHREVLEETGWTIARPLRLGSFRRHTYMPDYDIHAEKICHIYLALPVMRRAAPSEAGHDAVWADPETALRDLATIGDRAFLERVMLSLWSDESGRLKDRRQMR